MPTVNVRFADDSGEIPEHTSIEVLEVKEETSERLFESPQHSDTSSQLNDPVRRRKGVVRGGGGSSGKKRGKQAGRRPEEARMSDTAELAELLLVTPSDEIRFPDDSSTISLHLKNVHFGPVAFKIKVTSPDKFHVKPSSGVLQARETIDVEVLLREGVPPGGVVADKFLLLATPVNTAMTNQELQRMWKNLPADQLFEHKLKCTMEKTGPSHLTAVNSRELQTCLGKVEMLIRKLDAREDQLAALVRRQQEDHWLLVANLILLFLLILMTVWPKLLSTVCGGASKESFLTCLCMRESRWWAWWC